MNAPLEELYRAHHSSKRGDNFMLLGKERGAFLREHIGSGKRVLDIGCRDGALTSTYAQGNTVLGLDIDSGALARAKEKLGIEIKQVDLNDDWGMEPGSFDVVVAAEVVEHLYYPEVVFEKIEKVLAPGGVLLGTVPNAFSLRHRLRYLLKQKKSTPLEDPTHINHFTVRELERLLSAQFEGVRVMGLGRHAWLAKHFPQAFAFDLCFVGKKKV